MKLIGIIAIGLLSGVLSGYVLSVLWGWFISPVFGLPELSIMQALGLALIVTFLTGESSPKGEDTRSTGEIMIAVFLRLLFTLAIGFVFTLFI